MSNPKTLEGMVVASSTDWTLKLLLQQFQSLCDKTTVAVDLDSPQSREILVLCEEMGIEEILPMHVGGYIELVIQQLYNQAECDWILRLDDDELLSDGWFVKNKSYWLDGPKDYYHFSRAHLTSLNPRMFIDADKRFTAEGSPHWVDYWPNYQLRLFRKGHCLHRGEIHEGPEGKGEGGIIQNWPILHFNLLKPRTERERIVQKYKTIGGPGEIRGDTLLWEDYEVEPVECPYKVWLP